MRKRLLLVGAVLMLAFPMCARSAVARPTVPGPLVGTYRLHYFWHGNPNYFGTDMTVNADHTAQVGQYTFRWSRQGTTFRMWTKDVAYVGTKSRPGLNTRPKPGTMTSVEDDYGIWYAVKQS